MGSSDMSSFPPPLPPSSLAPRNMMNSRTLFLATLIVSSSQLSCTALCSNSLRASTSCHHRYRSPHKTSAPIVSTIHHHYFFSSSVSSTPSRRSTQPATSSVTICKYANNHYSNDEDASSQQPFPFLENDPSIMPQRQRFIPRRAMSHTQNLTNAEAATRAGYIIRSSNVGPPDDQNNNNNKVENHPTNNRLLGQQQQQKQRQERGQVNKERRGVRPLRSIRRIVHQSRHPRQQQQQQQLQQNDDPAPIIQEPTKSETSIRKIEIKNAPKVKLSTTSPPSLSSVIPTPPPLTNARQQKQQKQHQPQQQKNGSHRVTFKATREASHTLHSSSSFASPLSFAATLTEYMTQPVEKYSLLSFHDEDDVHDYEGGKHSHVPSGGADVSGGTAHGSSSGSNGRSSNSSSIISSSNAKDNINATNKQSTQRRWLVRRLTTEEARRYIDHSPLEKKGRSSSSSSLQQSNPSMSSSSSSATRANTSSSSSKSSGEIMKESNLFRLAVPLQPLIGWDLTPVIDLEVIPPVTTTTATATTTATTESGAKSDNALGDNYMELHDNGNVGPRSVYSSSTSKWEPLRSIRERAAHVVDGVRRQGDGNLEVDNHNHNNNHHGGNSSPPLVRIRSLSVSLLSTQDEVHAIMMSGDKGHNTKNNGWGNGRRNRNNNSDANNTNGQKRRNTNNSSAPPRANSSSSSKMQEEAIGMVGKVEEWLRPHITFEAELSWTDGAITQGDDPKSSHQHLSSFASIPTIPPSTVTVKSTAITSLTIPKLPAGILHATVPSAFLVKRLGATLTSKALEVCLPRFLKQLERDYYRWSGVDFKVEGANSEVEEKENKK